MHTGRGRPPRAAESSFPARAVHEACLHGAHRGGGGQARATWAAVYEHAMVTTSDSYRSCRGPSANTCGHSARARFFLLSADAAAVVNVCRCAGTDELLTMLLARGKVLVDK